MSNFERDKRYWDRQFQTIFGGGLNPYEFQRDVARHLVNDRNVILQAQTGAGKTKAAGDARPRYDCDDGADVRDG